ncbi:MAG: 50S ribosomal protein L16 [Nitrososphaerota archaeon]|jgi:large subunit ribosomal protein L10e|nr:50S ribosomal protein L16 [Nitrososphaerota archaeon]MDG6977534.1 50S ribosomal protein L16 [Nitrososphaerota archaeon]MDG7006183.1 50S ribosomal protein L16 [Nitrososphaerota archaeon]MDG7020598.1 50S ribosomal protein L16 [Nitrososphaerota archaeon]MDG7022048.1 50S ribosomal protein L16 [Nitrososphaerota archaeon]
MFYNKKFAPGTPNPKVARFTTGKFGHDYDYKLELISNARLQIRSNALEAARVAASKKLASIGEEAFYLRVVTYPHVVMRENKMIATAGADRLQEGMRKAFGKPIGVAARVDIGSVILDILIKAENLDKAKAALKAATTKLPFTYKIVVTPLKQIEAAVLA